MKEILIKKKIKIHLIIFILLKKKKKNSMNIKIEIDNNLELEKETENDIQEDFTKGEEINETKLWQIIKSVPDFRNTRKIPDFPDKFRNPENSRK